MSERATFVPCPKCGEPLVEKTGKHGRFWGCSTWPKCSGSLSAEHGDALAVGENYRPRIFPHLGFIGGDPYDVFTEQDVMGDLGDK